MAERRVAENTDGNDGDQNVEVTKCGVGDTLYGRARPDLLLNYLNRTLGDHCLCITKYIKMCHILQWVILS